jgi:hypothetical protein
VRPTVWEEMSPAALSGSVPLKISLVHHDGRRTQLL